MIDEKIKEAFRTVARLARMVPDDILADTLTSIRITIDAYVAAEARARMAEYALMPCEHFSMAQCRHNWTLAEWEMEVKEELSK